MSQSSLTIQSKVTLNNGVEIPYLGLGVFRSAEGKEAREAVRLSLELGYRHIDTAMIYGNEQSVGEAVRESSLPRSEIFVTTKLWNADQGYDSALEALETSLGKMGLEQVDLYLIHWPVQDKRLDSWRALETLYQQGRCRAIGVSNYMVHHLEELLEVAQVTPAVNQIELTPYNYRSRKDVVDFCRQHRIQVQAYSPLTRGQKLKDPRLVDIAQRYNKSTAQILIRWALERELIVLPKSAHPERIKENAAIFDFSISKEDLELLESFDEGLHVAWNPVNEA